MIISTKTITLAKGTIRYDATEENGRYHLYATITKEDKTTRQEVKFSGIPTREEVEIFTRKF